MPDPVRWGPDNPHPLSQMRTELVWDGKYDEYGRRRSVDVAGAAMPMQKIRDRGHAQERGPGIRPDHFWGTVHYLAGGLSKPAHLGGRNSMPTSETRTAMQIADLKSFLKRNKIKHIKARVKHP